MWRVRCSLEAPSTIAASWSCGSTRASYDVHYWRTRSGLEVDFILGAGEVAVEVKGSAQVRDRELRPLRAFAQEHRPRAALVVSNEPAEREAGGIRIMPWEQFLRRLWAGEIIA